MMCSETQRERLLLLRRQALQCRVNSKVAAKYQLLCKHKFDGNATAVL